MITQKKYNTRINISRLFNIFSYRSLAVKGGSSFIKYGLTLMVISFFYSESVFGQRWKLRRYEVGFGLGTTEVFGDIGGSANTNTWFGLRDIKINSTRMCFTALGRYKLDPRYSIKLNGILGYGSGTDAGSRNDRGRSYTTTLFELSGQLEYNLISENSNTRSDAIFSRRGMVNNYSTFNAYGFIGAGALYYNPKFGYSDTSEIASVDKYTGYKKFAVVAPFGIGVKFIIDDRWLLNAELGYRLTSSDFLDGYTQTAASKHKDSYYFLTICVNYRLKTAKGGVPAFFQNIFGKSDKVVNPNKATRKPKSEKEARQRKN